MNKTLLNMAKARQREQAIEDGYYDGRFRTKVVKDKKKQEKKHRNKRFFDHLED